jgi:hypothetical protein
LVAGAHRTIAIRTLYADGENKNWSKIEARECSKEDAKLYEIDENLFHNTLTAEQRHEHIFLRYQMDTADNKAEVLEAVIEKNLKSGNLPKKDDSADIVRAAVLGSKSISDILESIPDDAKPKVKEVIKSVAKTLRVDAIKSLEQEFGLTRKYTRDIVDDKAKLKSKKLEDEQKAKEAHEKKFKSELTKMKRSKPDDQEQHINHLYELAEAQSNIVIDNFNSMLMKSLEQFDKDSEKLWKIVRTRVEVIDSYEKKNPEGKKFERLFFKGLMENPRGRWLLSVETLPVFMKALQYFGSEDIHSKIAVYMEKYGFDDARFGLDKETEHEKLLRLVEIVTKPMNEFHTRPIDTMNKQEAELDEALSEHKEVNFNESK